MPSSLQPFPAKRELTAYTTHTISTSTVFNSYTAQLLIIPLSVSNIIQRDWKPVSTNQLTSA
jgi:hypothetical protein